MEYDSTKYVNWRSELRRQQRRDPSCLEKVLQYLADNGGLSRVDAALTLSGKRKMHPREFMALLDVLGLPKPWNRV